jgi:hypothetical protein
LYTQKHIPAEGQLIARLQKGSVPWVGCEQLKLNVNSISITEINERQLSCSLCMNSDKAQSNERKASPIAIFVHVWIYFIMIILEHLRSFCITFEFIALPWMDG